MTKGELIRLFLSSDDASSPSKVIAAAQQLSIHFSCTVESSVTKDSVGDWDEQEITGITYDITSQALVRSGETIESQVEAQDLDSIEDIYEAGTPVNWQIANVSGDNNRTKGTVLFSGAAVLTQLSIQAQNRTKATYQTSLAGYGDFTIGS